jgi:hypothetical protein
VKTLADVLGVRLDLDKSDATRVTYTEVTSDELFTLDTPVEEIAQKLLHSKEYRQHLLRMIMMDDIPPALETRLWEYAYGKPVEHVEVKDKTPRLEDVPLEQLEARAAMLMRVAQQLRMQRETPAEESSDEESNRVHIH